MSKYHFDECKCKHCMKQRAALNKAWEEMQADCESMWYPGRPEKRTPAPMAEQDWINEELDRAFKRAGGLG